MENKEFITTVYTDSMSKYIRTLKCSLELDIISLDELKGKNLISGIKSVQLVNTLKKSGLTVEVSHGSIELMPGDVVYCVSTGIALHSLEGEELPPHAVINITAYKAVKRKEKKSLFKRLFGK